MARATWDDFRSKWGFEEGAVLEARDLEARSKLVGMLNESPALQTARLRAVEYDRPGLHNCCMIVVLPASEECDETLLQLWKRQEISEQALPDSLDIDELIVAAYEA